MPITNQRLRMTRKNTPPQIIPSLFALGDFPTWERVRLLLCSMPAGSGRRIAEYLGVSPSTVSEMLKRGSQPSYSRVVSLLQFLQDNGTDWRRSVK